jgi:nitronate monooxygenase
MIDLPSFKVGNLEINLIQGGMGVGVSGKNLASAVANCKGAGIIASVGLGALKKYPGDYVKASQDALRDEIRYARKLSNGVIGVNIMNALTNYRELVQVAAEENVDLIISGAGIPRDLPGLIKDKSISLVPIVSHLAVAQLVTRAWKKYNKIPDAFIVEGPLAGGHLGFDYEQLVNGTAPSLENIVSEVIKFADTNFDKPVPVIAAGGIYTGKDILRFHKLGVAGVQMASRFVTTYECDASKQFKQVYLDSTPEDLMIINSPAGLPGRAFRNTFLDKVMNKEKVRHGCPYQCLRKCSGKDSIYCIADALIDAQRGHLEKGFVFTGVNGPRATRENSLDENGEFITVKTLMERISKEYNS